MASVQNVGIFKSKGTHSLGEAQQRYPRVTRPGIPEPGHQPLIKVLFSSPTHASCAPTKKDFRHIQERFQRPRQHFLLIRPPQNPYSLNFLWFSTSPLLFTSPWPSAWFFDSQRPTSIPVISTSQYAYTLQSMDARHLKSRQIAISFIYNPPVPISHKPTRKFIS